MSRILSVRRACGASECRLRRPRRGSMIVVCAVGLTVGAGVARAQSLSLDQAVAQAQTVNPAIRATRSRWEAARHQITQNYTPSDPQFSFTNSDSWRGFLKDSGEHNITLTQPLQFPGKGLLQGREAQRTAEIAHLAYLAAVRDITAQVKTAYYEIQLDLAVSDLIREEVTNLERVLKVNPIATSANLVTEADSINAKFTVEADRERQRQQAVTIANDKTALNVLLDRRPDEPLQVDPKFGLDPLETSLDQIVNRAIGNRQEILQAALAEKNQDTAVTLAQLEYAPDYSLGVGFDHWLIAGFAPAPNHTEDWNFSVAFNLPIFFWAKNEDIARAHQDLDAAREDLESVRIQTAGQVTTVYRQILRSRETALLYRDSLIPLARQAHAAMMKAYVSGQTDFSTLFGALRQVTDANSAYLRAVNQMLAQKVALEAAAGGGLQ